MPFRLRNIKEDLEDIGSRFDGAPDLEFRAATKALALEKSALSYQRVPPGYRFPYGHTHVKQEEVYVVLGGSGRMKVDDEIVELIEWDAVRVPPGTWRGYEARGASLRADVVGRDQRDKRSAGSTLVCPLPDGGGCFGRVSVAPARPYQGPSKPALTMTSCVSPGRGRPAACIENHETGLA